MVWGCLVGTYLLWGRWSDSGWQRRVGLLIVMSLVDVVLWALNQSDELNLELGDIGAFDEVSLGEPAVWSSNGFYWMLYTGSDLKKNRRLGLARSTDGVHWDKLPAVFAGSEAWDSKVVCDPTVLLDGGVIRVWFGGGDVASPDANLHGQIGAGILRPVNATVGK